MISNPRDRVDPYVKVRQEVYVVDETDVPVGNRGEVKPTFPVKKGKVVYVDGTGVRVKTIDGIKTYGHGDVFATEEDASREAKKRQDEMGDTIFGPVQRG